MTEHEMREMEAPYPRSLEELQEFIKEMSKETKDYGKAVYAMSLAATATMNYMAGHVGSTGFQYSCAGLDVIKRTHHIPGPFMLINVEKALYPQYNLTEELERFMEVSKPWLRERASNLLEEAKDSKFPPCPEALARWEDLTK